MHSQILTGEIFNVQDAETRTPRPQTETRGVSPVSFPLRNQTIIPICNKQAGSRGRAMLVISERKQIYIISWPARLVNVAQRNLP